MPKKIVKNASNQPIYLNLPGGRSLKIPAREQAEVEETDLSSGEMAFHRSRGNIILVEAAAAGDKAAAQEDKSGVRSEASARPAGHAKEEGGAD